MKKKSTFVIKALQCSKKYTKFKGRGSVVAVQACVENGYFMRVVHVIFHLFVYFARYVN
jgi:hypothetical protein